MYWILPDGRCVCWSVAELADKKQDELLDGNALQAYAIIGKELDFHPLGMLPDETFDEYRDNPGTLEERRHLSCIFFTFRPSAVASDSLGPPYRSQVFGKGYAGLCQKTKPKHVGDPTR